MHQSNIAMIGLGVMGKSLALNLLDHGFNVTGYDINQQNRMQLEREANTLAEHESKGRFFSAENLSQLLGSLEKPRVIALSVPAGSIVESVVDELLSAGLSHDDIVIDTGNSLWTDTEAREKKYAGQLRFFSTAVSGGEVGARFGPALMASGDESAWQYVQPMWQAIAAKVDEHGLPVDPFEKGEPCAAYLGPAGAGHYVKMVHNGIEYADMQLICEAYHFMSQVLSMSAVDIGRVFERWNRGVLNSYLMEISADILQTCDPVTGQPFVEVVLDKAGQKGTGLWTAVNSLHQGAAAPTIAQAVFARAISAQKSVRTQLSKQFPFAGGKSHCLEHQQVLDELEDALYCAKLVVYAQGFDLMRNMSDQEGWQLEFATIAKVWRAGCIIRAGFLQMISQAFDTDKTLSHLLLADDFVESLQSRMKGWRATTANSALYASPMPGIASALHYFDSLRCETLPANLLQAQRDYFGSHTYARVDVPENESFHLTWSGTVREQIKA
ncbi:NADP-dependent phosphogluconate dehydrogenase [Vibrio sinaloensis]|uniref:NADP-dependent phosphogluconate dehydrogenase n=1 Tax=Photobacterium sp. (strain ATCC 43367) TaxID=379097 RepID=UPI0035EE44C2